MEKLERAISPSRASSANGEAGRANLLASLRQPDKLDNAYSSFFARNQQLERDPGVLLSKIIRLHRRDAERADGPRHLARNGPLPAVGARLRATRQMMPAKRSRARALPGRRAVIHYLLDKRTEDTPERGPPGAT
jgi:hypothetical protein